MGEIVGVGLISHAPTIMFDEETRRELNDGKEISLVPGLVRLRKESSTVSARTPSSSSTRIG
jgi:hypothetical protein